MIDESFSFYDEANSIKNDNEDSISDLNKSIKLKNLSVRTNHTEYNIINLRNFFEKITEKNLLWMKDKELNKEEYKKHFIEDKIIDCEINENETLPIPIYLIYKVLYDYNFKSKKDNSGNFIQSLQNMRNEYDRTFQEINFNKNEIPSLFKNNIVETFKKFNKQPNEKEIKKLIEESEREYPKLMEYNYKYTHPIPKPVFMGKKILYLDDIYRFFFISPTTFIVELKTNTSGFMLVDAFYTVAKYKFETIFNNDLSTFQTKVNGYFTIEYVKDIWFKSQVESNGYTENCEYMTNFMVPNMIEELRLNFKEIVNNSKVLLEKEFPIGSDFSDNDTIYNESEICDIDVPTIKFRNINNNLNGDNKEKDVVVQKEKINLVCKDDLIKYCFYSFGLSILLFFFRYIFSDFPLYFILILILLNAFSINKKLQSAKNLKLE